MAEHGHGHEKAGGHGGQSEWTRHAWNAIKAIAAGVAVAAFAPPLLACSGVLMPAYMAKTAGILTGVTYLANQYDSPEKKGAGGHAH